MRFFIAKIFVNFCEDILYCGRVYTLLLNIVTKLKPKILKDYTASVINNPKYKSRVVLTDVYAPINEYHSGRRRHFNQQFQAVPLPAHNRFSNCENGVCSC